jgi:hypothetical protein
MKSMLALGGEMLTPVAKIEGEGKGLFKFDADLMVFQGDNLELQRFPANTNGKIKLD